MTELLLRYHAVPHIFDYWADVVKLEPNLNLYAAYLFDHPSVNDLKTDSYLEDERLQNSRDTKLGATSTKLTNLF